MSNNIERIVILDHDRHTVYIEDIDMNVVDEKYNGEEEEYIKANYDLGKNWTWDYIVSQVTNYPELKNILK
jgi:hypothetical protein